VNRLSQEDLEALRAMFDGEESPDFPALVQSCEDLLEEVRIRRALEGAALVHVSELRAWLASPDVGLGGFLDDLVRLVDLVDPEHASEVGSREVQVFERTIGIARLLEDDAVAASLVARAAARLWVHAGGNVASFAEMARSQAVAESK
jgi:hypothetical protein